MTNLVPLTTEVRCRAHSTANLTLAAATIVTVVWDTVDDDPHGFFNLGSSASRATIPTGLGGLYLASFSYRITNTTTPGVGYSAIWYSVNGAGGPEQRSAVNIGAGGTAASNWRNAHTVALPVPLVAGDYVEVVAEQFSGGSEHLAGTTETDYSSRFTLYRLGT